MATLEGELRKKTTDRARSRGAHWAISCRAIVFGLLLALVAGNVWPMLFLTLRLPLAGARRSVISSALSLVGTRRRSSTRDRSGSSNWIPQ